MNCTNIVAQNPASSNPLTRLDFEDAVQVLKILVRFQKLDIADLCRFACVDKACRALSSVDEVWNTIGRRIGCRGPDTKYKVLIHCKMLQLRQKWYKAELAIPTSPIEHLHLQVSNLQNRVEKRKIRGKRNFPVDKGIHIFTVVKMNELRFELENAYKKVEVYQRSVKITLFFAELYRDVERIPEEEIEDFVKENLPPHPSGKDPLLHAVERAKTNIRERKFTPDPSNEFYHNLKIHEKSLERGVLISSQELKTIKDSITNKDYESALKLIDGYYPFSKKLEIIQRLIFDTKSPKDCASLSAAINTISPNLLPRLYIKTKLP